MIPILVCSSVLGSFFCTYKDYPQSYEDMELGLNWQDEKPEAWLEPISTIQEK